MNLFYLDRCAHQQFPSRRDSVTARARDLRHQAVGAQQLDQPRHPSTPPPPFRLLLRLLRVEAAGEVPVAKPFQPVLAA